MRPLSALIRLQVPTEERRRSDACSAMPLPPPPGGGLFPTTLVAFSAGQGQQELGMEELKFPLCNYYLDESDPDILTLHRQDGSFVATFSASGATKEGICEAAEEDYRELTRALAG